VGLVLLEADCQVLDGESRFADTGVDAGGVRDRRRGDVADAAPRDRVIDGAQEVPRDLAHFVARFGDRVGGDGVGRRRGLELGRPAVSAGGLEDLTGAGRAWW